MTRAGSELDQMGSLRRSHTCGAVSPADVGSEVIVAGWVQRRRDHGGVIFIDLRDHEGLVQVVFRPEESAESHERAGEIRSEYVVLARGIVQRRTPDTINPEMATGEIEVVGFDFGINGLKRGENGFVILRGGGAEHGDEGE